MTPEKREKLVEDMAQGIASPPRYPWDKMTDREKQLTIYAAGAALAIAERAIREDCAEIANKEAVEQDSAIYLAYNWACSDISTAILASIPEMNNV